MPPAPAVRLPHPSKPSINNRRILLGKRKPLPSSGKGRSAVADSVAGQDAEDSVKKSKHTQDEDDKGAQDEDASEEEADEDEILIDVNTKRERQQLQHENSQAKKKQKTDAVEARGRKAENDEGKKNKDEDDEEDLINVDFGLYDPIPEDELTFRTLLKDFVPDHLLLQPEPPSSSASSPSSPFALHDFCALLAQQAVVGTTVKADGTEDPLGFISLILLTPPHPPSSSLPRPLHQLLSYFKSSIPASHSARLSSLFSLSGPSSSSHRPALLIQSRLLNVPIPLIGPLHTALVEDVAWARQQRGGEERWDVDRVLLMGRCIAVSGRMKGGGGRRGGGGGGEGGGAEMWLRWEEEVYERESEWSCRWRVPHRRTEGDDSEAATRREGEVAVLMCITWDGVKKAVKKIHEMAKES